MARISPGILLLLTLLGAPGFPGLPGAGAAPAPGRRAPAPDSLAGLRATLEAHVGAEAEQAFVAWTTGSDSLQGDLSNRDPILWDPASLVRVRAALAGAPDSRSRLALQLLRRRLERIQVNRDLAELDDSLASVQLAAAVGMDSSWIPWLQVPGAVARQPDAGRRGALWAAQDSLYRQLRPVYLARLEALRGSAARLGYGSRFAWYQDQQGTDLAMLEKRVRALLADTDSLWTRLVGRAAGEQLARAPGELHRPDFLRLGRTVVFDPYFSAELELAALRRTWSGMGLDPEHQRNLTLDLLPRRGKNLRAAAFLVRVPGDVRLSAVPTGGLSDWQTLFHEYGHAQHAALVRQPEMEFRLLGDDAVREGMGLFSEKLLADPEWVARTLHLESRDAGNYLERSVLLDLLRVRREAGRFLYCMDLHRGRVNPEVAYAAAFRRAWRVPVDERDALRALSEDDGFACADQLQGWLLQAMLRSNLRRRFGGHYFEDPRAGAAVRALMSQGTELTPDAMARKLGFTWLDHRPLLEEWQRLAAAGGE